MVLRALMHVSLETTLSEIGAKSCSGASDFHSHSHSFPDILLINQPRITVARFSIHRVRELAHRPISDHLETLSWYYHQAECRAFTRRHALDFDGFIPREELVAESADSLANSNNYRPYSNFHLKPLLREALNTGIQFENFVDVGCGKGQPCIFAKKYFGFKNVYGIDFCEPLIKIALQNLAKTHYENVHFLVADATTWKIPAGNTLVFLANPFNEIIMEKFLVSNLEHFTRYRSLIAYGFDFFKSTMCRLGFEIIFRSNRHQYSLLQYTGSRTQ
jgi:SAM-dependent methyltransferase